MTDRITRWRHVFGLRSSFGLFFIPLRYVESFLHTDRSRRAWQVYPKWGSTVAGFLAFDFFKIAIWTLPSLPDQSSTWLTIRNVNYQQHQHAAPSIYSKLCARHLIETVFFPPDNPWRLYLCLDEFWRRAWRCLCALSRIWLFHLLPHLHPRHALATQKSPLAGSPALTPARDIAGTGMRREERKEGEGHITQEMILIYDTVLSEYENTGIKEDKLIM